MNLKISKFKKKSEKESNKKLKELENKIKKLKLNWQVKSLNKNKVVKIDFQKKY